MGRKGVAVGRTERCGCCSVANRGGDMYLILWGYASAASYSAVDNAPFARLILAKVEYPIT